MNRMLALILAGLWLVGLPGPARAQMTIDEFSEPDGYGSGGSAQDVASDGGLGLGYSPAVRGGGIVMDRFGIIRAVPRVRAQVAARPQRAQAQQPRARFHRASARPNYQLPTGSLYWPDQNDVMLYSAFKRYAAYGDGYGTGPDGTADHSLMYKGWPLED
jgi:hypothetical protein